MAETESNPARVNDFSDFQSPHEASLDRLVEAVDRAYHRPWLMMWRSFLHGFMTAIGATVGTAVIVAILGYVVQTHGGIDLLNPLIDKISGKVVQTQLNQAKDLNTILDSNK